MDVWLQLLRIDWLVQVAVLFNPFIGLVLATFCGVTIPYPTMITFWRSWIYQLDPYTRTLAAMVSTELQWATFSWTLTTYSVYYSGLIIRCQPDEFAIFNPPTGQNCSAWAQPFVNNFGGYIDNPLDTVACRYCQYAVGDQFFVPLNISFSHRWRDAFILFSYFSAYSYCWFLDRYSFSL